AHLHVANTSVIGGVKQGVLAVTEGGGEITIISGWNYYLGANTGGVGSSQFDFQTVVTHELGHALGLGHSSDSASVMFASLKTGTAKRNLTAADLRVLEKESGAGHEALMAVKSS